MDENGCITDMLSDSIDENCSPSLEEAIEYLEDLQQVMPLVFKKNGTLLPVSDLKEDDIYLHDDSVYFEVSRIDSVIKIYPIELFDGHNNGPHWTNHGFYIMVHNREHIYYVNRGTVCECDGLIPNWLYDKYNRGTNEFEDYVEIGG